jgi:hypothetical protein
MADVVSYNITIDDTAPQITYSPLIQSNQTTAPNLVDGWFLNFLDGGFNTSPGQVGVGQSAHVTGKDGATLSIAFTGAYRGCTLLSSSNVAPSERRCPASWRVVIQCVRVIAQAVQDELTTPFRLP